MPVEGAQGPTVTAIEQTAMDMVQMMNGEIQWSGVEALAAQQGCEDVDLLYPLLVLIRNRYPQPPRL